MQLRLVLHQAIASNAEGAAIGLRLPADQGSLDAAADATGNFRCSNGHMVVLHIGHRVGGIAERVHICVGKLVAARIAVHLIPFPARAGQSVGGQYESQPVVGLRRVDVERGGGGVADGGLRVVGPLSLQGEVGLAIDVQEALQGGAGMIVLVCEDIAQIGVAPNLAVHLTLGHATRNRGHKLTESRNDHRIGLGVDGDADEPFAKVALHVLQSHHASRAVGAPSAGVLLHHRSALSQLVDRHQTGRCGVHLCFLVGLAVHLGQSDRPLSHPIGCGHGYFHRQLRLSIGFAERLGQRVMALGDRLPIDQDFIVHIIDHGKAHRRHEGTGGERLTLQIGGRLSIAHCHRMGGQRRVADQHLEGQRTAIRRVQVVPRHDALRGQHIERLRPGYFFRVDDGVLVGIG